MKNFKNRKVVGLSLNPEELDVMELLMTRGGYTSFSEFAKARIFGSATETENRLKELEREVINLRDGYERHHKLWVDTVKQVANTDLEPLLAALYMLNHKMAGQQSRDELDQLVDLDSVKHMAAISNSPYLPVKRQTQTPTHTPDIALNPYQQGKEDSRRALEKAKNIESRYT